jgi:4-hydroxymandelate oxidase
VPDPVHLDRLFTLGDFEAAANEVLDFMASEYLKAGIADEITLRENRAAFERLRLLPRLFVDVSRIDVRVTLFGREHSAPILLAPVGLHKIFHPEGELATAKGAAQANTTLVSATFSSYTIEEICAAAECPVWFQIYVQNDRGFTRTLVERAVAAGCEAICITPDTPVNGPRERELRAGFHLPPGVERANLRELGPEFTQSPGRHIYTPVRAADVTWKDLVWLRSICKVPLVVKGVLNPEDAIRALDCGVDGLIVSNHGGRGLDTTPATIDALPAVVNAVAGRVPVLVDGGIRRGTDVYQSLARGATAVLIGRPYMHGLSVAGAAGVARVVEILRTELEMTMGLMGRATVSDIGSTLCQPPMNADERR